MTQFGRNFSRDGLVPKTSVPSSSSFSELQGNPQEVLYSPKILEAVDIDLSTQADEIQINKVGSVIYYSSALDSSNAVLFNRPIKIRFNRRSADQITFIPGMAFSGVPFDVFYIEVPAGYDAGDIGQLVVTTDSPNDRVRFE